MHRRIVPGWYHFAVLSLRVIPARANVGLRPLEDHECVKLSCVCLPLRVGPCQMAFDQPQRTITTAFQHGRQMRRGETVVALRYENGKGVCTHHRVHLCRVLDLEIARSIHGMERSKLTVDFPTQSRKND